MTAIGKALEPAYRSKLERDYAAVLDAQRAAGEIRAWWFEAMTFRLGHDCRYTPDFAIQLPDLSIEMREVKGERKWDGAMEKVRTACEMFPFVFRLVTRSKEGVWDIAEVGAPRKRAPKSVAAAAEQRVLEPQRRSMRTSRPVEAAANRAPLSAVDDWKPGDPIPDGFAVLAGKLVTMEFALDKARMGK